MNVHDIMTALGPEHGMQYEDQRGITESILEEYDEGFTDEDLEILLDNMLDHGQREALNWLARNLDYWHRVQDYTHDRMSLMQAIHMAQLEAWRPYAERVVEYLQEEEEEE